jgi:hypothetical protein
MSWKDRVREMGGQKPAALDSATDNSKPALDGASDYVAADIKLKAIAAVQQWLETDDLEDGEGYADRLMAMMIGIADMNKDGEISDDEQAIIDLALNAAWDYLAQYGAEEDDISALLNDWDNEAAERLRDLLASSLPEGDEADADLNNFVFGEDEQGAVFDSAYRKVVAVRGGKKVRINKRISGTVRLSARQKLAIRKAGMKSHSAKAQMRRMKSMKIRRKAGL